MTSHVDPVPGFHSRLTLAACAILSLSLLASAYAQDLTPGTYISFDAPGAGTASSQGTYPAAINRKGWIGGTVSDGSYVLHGFLRTPNGVFIVVHPPTALETHVTAINANNEAVGSFDSASGSHGFIRDASGNYVQLDVPGASSTIPSGINDTAVVVGYEYAKDGSGAHGFLWDAQNQYTVFDVPGAQRGTTFPAAINGNGAVTGFCLDSINFAHGFVRDPDSHFATFLLDGGTQTRSTAINTLGQITGWTNDGLGDTFGFLRAAGTTSLFGVSGSPGTVGTGISDAGVIVGYIFSDAGGDASFERDQSGNIAVISLPFGNTSNVAVGINRGGQITGYYADSTGAFHGWVGVP